MFVKAQLHFHTNDDPHDNIFINYSPYEAIDKAATYGYKILSFTNHKKLIYSSELRKYAFKKGIILVPGVEYNIHGRHVLIYNADDNVHSITNFEDLRNYKLHKKNLFVVAPHPFYPFKNCLNQYLIKYHDLFDGVEYSILYLKKFGFKPNMIAKNFAYGFQKPLLGTADVHDLKYINDTYTLINVDFDPYNLDIKKIDYYIKNCFDNIRKNNISIISKPLTLKRVIGHNIFFLKGFIKRGIKKTLKSKINNHLSL